MPYLTVNETAIVMHLSDSRIRHYLLAGKFPKALRAGKIWLIPEGDIKKFMEMPRQVGKPKKYKES